MYIPEIIVEDQCKTWIIQTLCISSKNTKQLYVKSFEYQNGIDIILIYQGRIKLVSYNKSKCRMVIDDTQYKFSMHFIERYIERFNIKYCKRYTLIEMIAKEILFVHNRANDIEYYTNITINARYGTIVIRKLKQITKVITYLRFGKRFQKDKPNIEWFESLF